MPVGGTWFCLPWAVTYIYCGYITQKQFLMKYFIKCLVMAGSLGIPLAHAQSTPQPPARLGLPLTVTIFSESISLPTIARAQKGGIGLKIGTEFYYRTRQGSQTLQSLNLGYYHHPGVQSGLFVSSEFGYRKYFGAFYADATLGGGALLLHPSAPSYVRHESGAFSKASPYQVKFMPSLGLGAGYRFRNHTAIFTRYELFGEMPFSQILLPHQALYLGARMNFNK